MNHSLNFYETHPAMVKILYLEDEVLLALDTQLTLNKAGYDDIVAAGNLAAATQAAEQQQIDLAILDINLGDGTTSLPLAKKLSERGVPLFFMTSYNVADDVASQYNAHVLNKPVSPHQLTATVKKLLNGK